jgi:flagellar basal-body rod modification protein FlgD
MTDDTIKGLKSGASFTVEEAQAQQQTGTKKSGSGMGLNPGEEMGQQEFLTLLVNQLQNQDPLSPMDSDEFSVQLAQFSQLEQLIGINEKLDSSTPGAAGTGAESMASMASFLGHNVTLRGNTVDVASGQAGDLLLDLPEGTQSARIDFTDKDGTVVGSKEVAEVQPGTQTVALDGLNVPNGSYTLRVVAVTADGQFQELEPKKGGLVEGFVLEPEPALLVGGETISLEDVVEVTLNDKK